MSGVGKLNVGRIRSAAQVLDEQLIREALETLEKILPYAEAFDPFEYGRFGEPTQDDDIEQAQVIAAKLKERLLEE
ncbi:hypothetical protein LCGC14_2656990 [marine sediment metagenome]|uniref:Uncharacterized protein n=1 Tax=marine sediment metagenome TaxID=412755 RepID=A0A0F8ZT83_9ZZZZ